MIPFRVKFSAHSAGKLTRLRIMGGATEISVLAESPGRAVGPLHLGHRHLAAWSWKFSMIDSGTRRHAGAVVRMHVFELSLLSSHPAATTLMEEPPGPAELIGNTRQLPGG
jgi:hypothetical protein